MLVPGALIAATVSGAVGASVAQAYGPTHVYQLTYSLSCDNKSSPMCAPNAFGLGGAWGWIEPDSDGTADGQATFCAHGQGAFHQDVNGVGWTTTTQLNGQFPVGTDPNGNYIVFDPNSAIGFIAFPATPGHSRSRSARNPDPGHRDPDATNPRTRGSTDRTGSGLATVAGPVRFARHQPAEPWRGCGEKSAPPAGSNRGSVVCASGASGADRQRDRGHRGAAVPIQLGEPLASWVLDPDLDKYCRMDPRVFVGAALDTIAAGIPDDIRADHLACYAGDRFAESMRYIRGYPEELPPSSPLIENKAG